MVELPPPVVTTTPFTPNYSIAVSWEDLYYKADNKEILRGLTGIARPARTLAIMGSSGAGKTTFLNAICDRLLEDASHSQTGRRLLNGVDYKREYRSVIGFVTQDDIVFTTSTPSDALRFSVRLRRGVDEATAQSRVEAMLNELNLVKAKNTVFGIPGILVGLSGGERKRTSIGMELICDPKVLLLDEPTSGLDSVTATSVVTLLQEAARRGRTVIFTIHQPTADAVAHFDDLMLMAQGKVVFHGPMSHAVEYFRSIGYSCPVDYTPTDYFMVLLQDKEISEKLIGAWSEHLGRGYMPEYTQQYSCATFSGSTEETRKYLLASVSHNGASVPIQFRELFVRNIRNLVRNRQYVVATLFQAVFFSVIAAAIFNNMKDDVVGVTDRQGLLFMICANVAISSTLLTINTFPHEKPVFIREQQCAAYSPAVYFAAKSLAELPLQVATIVLQCIILYFPTGLALHASHFFIFLAITLLLSQVSGGVGLAISAAAPTYELATGFFPVVMVPGILAGGLVASTTRLRPYWYWMEKLSYVRHGFVLYAKNELESLDHISCDVGKFGQQFCARQARDGRQVLANIHFDDKQHQVWVMWLSLALMFVLVRVIALIALHHVARTKF